MCNDIGHVWAIFVGKMGTPLFFRRFLVLAAYLALPYSAFSQGCLPTVVLGQNLTICQGTSLTLNATNPNATYLWQDGSTNATFTVQQSGLYWVVVTNSCGSASDSVNVTVLPAPNADLGPDTLHCAGQSISLGTPLGSGVTASWSTGQTTPTILVNQPGTYWLTLTNLCGQSTDTIQVSTLFPPNLNLGPDRVLCPGQTDSIVVNIPSGHQLQWNNSTVSSSVFSYSQPGTYSATLTNNCGSISDQIVVRADPPADFLPDVLFLCSGAASLTINPGILADSYNWSNGSTQPFISVTTPGTYWMQYTNACGVKSDTVQVLQEPAINIDLGPDRIECDSVLLQANVPFGSQYVWSNGSSDTLIRVTETDSVWLQVSTGCQTYSDTAFIQVTQFHDLPDTTTLFRCPGQPLAFTISPFPNTSYVWPSLGVLDSSVTFTQTGSYTVFANNICGQDSAVFTVVDSTGGAPDLGPDSTSCAPIWLKPNVGVYNSILWSNGSTDDSIRVLNGTYWVQIDNGCALLSDTVTLSSQAPPRINLADTLTICDGQSITLSGPNRSFVSYAWSTGDTTSQISVSQAGMYHLTISTVCGSRSDSVYVETESFPTAYTPLDTVFICQGDTAFATLPFSWYADSVQWSNGQTGSDFFSLNPGMYSHTITGVCGSATDSFFVAVAQAPAEVLPDTVFFCPGDSALLDLSSAGAEQIVWQDGDSSSLKYVSQTGWFSVFLANGCGQLADSVFIQSDLPLNGLDLGRDTILCQAGFILQSGHSAHFNHVWSDSSSANQLTVQQSGTYWLQVSNSCQQLTDSIYIQILQAPQLFLAPEFQFCLGSSLSIDITSTNASYLWSTGDTTSVVSLNQPGTYWAQLSNQCGVSIDTFGLVVAPPVQLNIGPDTTICQGDSITLDAGTGYFGRQWSNGSTDQFITVSQAGVYFVDAQGFCNTVRDSIVISVLDTPVFDLGPDETICIADDSVSLRAPQGFASYLWNDGSTADSLVVSEAGTYFVTIGNGCFTYTDSLQVITEEVPIVDLGPDTILCRGTPLNLSSNGHLLNWEDGSQSLDRTISAEGLYSASYTNTCGTFTDSILVTYQDSIVPMQIDTVMCLDDTLRFSIPFPSDTNWWFNGGTELEQRFIFPGEYTYYRANSCGVVASILNLSIVDCECEVYVPTAFSPNGDGVNDRFEVKHACDLYGFELQIFDRWGGLVFQTDDPAVSWDGNSYGTALATGMYRVNVLTLVRQGEGYRPSRQQINLYLIR